MRHFTLGCLFVAVVTVTAHGEARSVAFSQDDIGQPPRGFEFGHTAGIGRPGTWVVQAEGGNKILAQTDNDATRARFPLAVLTDVVATDVDLSVRLRPVSGQVDQAGGLVWRYQNQDNYYLLRANGSKTTWCCTKSKERTDLPVRGEGRTYGKKIEVPAGQWSTLRVLANGTLFEVYFNGAKLYEAEDATFSTPGKVGVWTKADSVTQFDDLSVATK